MGLDLVWTTGITSPAQTPWIQKNGCCRDVPYSLNWVTLTDAKCFNMCYFYFYIYVLHLCVIYLIWCLTYIFVLPWYSDVFKLRLHLPAIHVQSTFAKKNLTWHDLSNDLSGATCLVLIKAPGRMRHHSTCHQGMVIKQWMDHDGSIDGFMDR